MQKGAHNTVIDVCGEQTQRWDSHPMHSRLQVWTVNKGMQKGHIGLLFSSIVSR